MRISKNRVLDFLTKCQIERGGYTGRDVAKLAKSIPVLPKALRKWINYWTSNDPGFKLLQYHGKQIIPLTLDDFILIAQRLKEKPLGRMSYILREMIDNRQKQGKNPIPQSTFYHFVNSRKESLTAFEWFPRIRSRSRVIQNHLSRIKADETLLDQALLILEAQVDFIDVRYREHTNEKDKHF
jgi:hypothetical protein